MRILSVGRGETGTGPAMVTPQQRGDMDSRARRNDGAGGYGKQDGPMQVNPQQLLDDGFIILPQVVPPEQLDSLRASYETIVERQHRIWSGELDWDVPVAMDYKSKQPRIVLQRRRGRSHRRYGRVQPA